MLTIQQLHQNVRICVRFYWFFVTFPCYVVSPFSLQMEIFLYFREAFFSLGCPPCFLSSFSGPPVLHMLASSFISGILPLNAVISVLLSHVFCDISQVYVPCGWHCLQQYWVFHYSKVVFVSWISSFHWVPPLIYSTPLLCILLSLALFRRIHVLFISWDKREFVLRSYWFPEISFEVFFCLGYYILPLRSLHRLCVEWFLCTWVKSFCWVLNIYR